MKNLRTTELKTTTATGKARKRAGAGNSGAELYRYLQQREVRSVLDLEAQSLLNKARSGDSAARELFIAARRDFVRRIACHCAGRALVWENDDELSVALAAFHEAIDTFDPARNATFDGFVAAVIRHRLIDYWRKEKRQRAESLDVLHEESGWEPAAPGALGAGDSLDPLNERAMEIADLQLMLAEYHVSFDDLVRASPRHADTRASLRRAAEALAHDPRLLSEFAVRRQVPLQELAVATGLSRKVLERGRRYIVALTVVFAADDLEHIKSHLGYRPHKEG